MKNKVKYKKIRGKNRRIRDIHHWGQSHLLLDTDYLDEYQRDYVKFWVSPWSRLSLTNSVYPEPDGEYKALLLNYLCEIYQSWNEILSAQYDTYYLQIWLFENAISRSQVVCAVKDQRHYYDNTFGLIDDAPSMTTSQHYCSLLDKFQWVQRREIEAYDLNDECDKAIFDAFPPECHLGENRFGYQMVERDKVWINGV